MNGNKVQKLSDEVLEKVNGGSNGLDGLDLDAILQARQGLPSPGSDTLDRSINNTPISTPLPNTGMSEDALAKFMMDEAGKSLGQPLPKLELLG